MFLSVNLKFSENYIVMMIERRLPDKYSPIKQLEICSGNGRARQRSQEDKYVRYAREAIDLII